MDGIEQAVRAALERVLGRAVDARDDTPLAALGFDATAWPALAATLAHTARIADADVRGVSTFGDLIAVVRIRVRSS